jgi:2-methylcitrate dehydratase PrpD
MSGQMQKSTTEPAAVVLARHVAGVTLAGLPADAVRAVATFTLDTIGVGVAGRRSAYADGVRAVALGWGAATPDNAAYLFAGGPALPVPSAVFVNAFQAHALEFDCVHEGAVLHPFTVVVPVVLAEAERTGLSGARFVAAVAAGVDVAAGLGVAATSQIKFFRPATCGLFGAVGALCNARGLNAEQTAHAFGYALAFASGTMQAHVEGTPALAASVGAAARSAFAAVDLVCAGLPGPLGSVDGPFGYLSLFETAHDGAPVLGALGQIWRVNEVAWKPFPTGRAAHGGIDMICTLRTQGLTPETLASLVIEAPPLIHHLVGRPIADPPLEVNYARLCLPYVGAVALRRGTVTLDDFTPEALNDPATHALARRISVQVNATTSQSAFTPQRAIATLTDGRVQETSVAALLGAPARPLSRDQHLAKFRACMAFGLGEARPDVEDALIAACDQLEALPDVAVLARLSSPTPTPPNNSRSRAIKP